MNRKLKRTLSNIWRDLWRPLAFAAALALIVALAGCAVAPDAPKGMQAVGSQEQRSVTFNTLDDGRRAALVQTNRIELYAEPEK